MDIAALNAFIAVARDGSFSKASERLHITQPAVSKRVASLEVELGVELFNRVARSISLTEAGKQLLPKAQDLVSLSSELQRYASNLNDDISGDLSVSIAHHVGLYRMESILHEFNKRYPNVTLDIRFEDSEQAFNSVEHGDIEFGVITLPSVLPDKIHSEIVWVDDLNIVVAHDHKLAQQQIAQQQRSQQQRSQLKGEQENQQGRVSIENLADYACVLPTRETETHQIMQRLFSSHQLNMQVQMETNSLETLKMLVGAGLGWSLLPSTMLSSGDLTILDLGVNLTRNLGLVSHSKRSLSNAAQALRGLIRGSVIHRHSNRTI